MALKKQEASELSETFQLKFQIFPPRVGVKKNQATRETPCISWMAQQTSTGQRDPHNNAHNSSLQMFQMFGFTLQDNAWDRLPLEWFQTLAKNWIKQNNSLVVQSHGATLECKVL